MGVTVKIGPKYQVVIPLPIRKKVRIHPQNEVLVEEVNGAIIILPKPTSCSGWVRRPGKALIRKLM
jgi:AbrB family looped-hinge helix DNA binding protein